MSDHSSGPKDRDDARRAGAEIDPDASASAEEVAAAARLRDQLERPIAGDTLDGDLDLIESLRAAWSPDPLDARAHAEMLDDLPMNAEELALAAELRDALDTSAPDASTKTSDVAAQRELAVVLRSAWAPRALSEDEHRAIVVKAIAAHAEGKVVPLVPRPRPVQLAVVATTTVLALAASLVVWMTTAPPAETPLARARSTQPLFSEPFKAYDPSARIDRIAVARASDYRDNRFAKWGVR
jgi:hypothetical protein